MKRAISSFLIATGFFLVPLFFPFASFAQAPPNDNFANSITITGASVSIQGTNVSATMESGEPQYNTTNATGSTVWYNWTAPFTGEVSVTGSSCCLTCSLGAFTGASVTNLSLVTHGENAFTFMATSNTTYNLQVDSENGLTGVFTLTLNATQTVRPLNDNFANSIALSGMNVTVQSVNIGATTQSGENTGGGGAVLGSSVWYSWTAPANGIAHLSIASLNSDPNFIPGVQTFTGNTLASLVSPPVTQAGDIPVTPGEVLQIQVASIYYTTSEFGGDPGPFSLNVWLETAQPASTNDYFANRLEITTPTYQFNGSIYGATNEPGEPLPSPGDYQTLWWDFVPPSPGIITVSLSSPEFPSVATLYEGTNVASLTAQSGLPSSVLVYAVQTNQDYALQVASAPFMTGNLSLNTRFDPQAYDNFETPEILAGTNITINRNNVAATLEPGEPVWNSDNSGHTLWYSWTAPFTGRVNILSRSITTIVNMAVYTGSVLTNLTLVADGSTALYFAAVSNTVYNIQVDGGGGYTGAFTLNLSANPYLPAPNDNFTNSTVLYGFSGGSGGTISFATTEPGEPTYFGGIPSKSLWWTWQVPVNAYVNIVNGEGLATNIVYAVYTGSSVDALTLVAIGTNGVYFPANGGTVLQIAAVVTESTMGDVQFGLDVDPTYQSAPVSGNLLCQGSFENTGLNLTCWQTSGEIGGYVGENGGADGTTWPTLGAANSLSQSFATVPGRNYLVNFATEGPATSLQVSWDSNVLGTVTPPNFWFWTNYMFTATNTTSRLTFYNNGGGYPALDGVSVVWMNEPPIIITPPSSASTLAGGDVTFLVGAQGSPPLSYQWYFNNSPLAGKTGDSLELDQASLTQSGQYYVIVSNAYGFASNTPVTLAVEPTNQLVLVLQPSGGAVPIGGYYDLSAAASGPGLITYQWYLNNAPVTGATNQELVFNPFQATNAGTYQVIAQCGLQSVLSLSATLTATNYNGGGTVSMNNDFFIRSTEYYEPIYDVDGVTMLSSTVSDYVAQLYAGPTLTQLSPAGYLTTFFSDPGDAGLFVPETVTIPNVPARSSAFMQVRVWDRKNGLSYEEARALGGKFGHSAVLQIVTAGIPIPPPNLTNLASFSLQAGTPQFTAGVIKPAGYQTNGVPVWSLLGNAGSLYVIMSSTNNLAWQPMLVITNVTGTVTFEDPNPPSTNCVFYRARILD